MSTAKKKRCPSVAHYPCEKLDLAHLSLVGSDIAPATKIRTDTPISLIYPIPANPPLENDPGAILMGITRSPAPT